MGHRSSLRILSILATSAIMLVAVLIGAQLSSHPARANVYHYFASPSGSGTICTALAPCQLDQAVKLATNGDTIYLAQGTYTGSGDQVLLLTETLTLRGGWDGGTSEPPTCNPTLHPSVLDGQNARRVVLVNNPVANINPTLIGLVIQRGTSDVSFENAHGGGVLVYYDSAVLISNIITGNFGASYGGGLSHYSGTVILTDNQFIKNSTQYGGGGVSLGRYSRTTISGNIFTENSADYGGALHSDKAHITVTANIIEGNIGTALLFSGDSGRFWLSNNWILNNPNYGVSVYDQPGAILHNTFVANQGYAARLLFDSVITVSNNIFANQPNNTVYYDTPILNGSHNLFWNNHTNTFTGTQALVADPQFVDAAGGDYHLGPASPAANAAVDLGVSVDIDGQARPLGLPDIGADERYLSTYLPLIRR